MSPATSVCPAASVPLHTVQAGQGLVVDTAPGENVGTLHGLQGAA